MLPEELDDRVRRLAEGLHRHPVYARVRDEASVRVFMRHHVFAVWDFQSLLKALQRRLTCVELPWLPTGDPQARRLINEVVLEEESDEHPDGGYASHFELYLQAMRECGADTGPIERLTSALADGEDYRALLDAGGLPGGVGRFLDATLRSIESGDLHRMVALFTYSREDLIPGMFTALVRELARRDGGWRLFRWYLERHIEVDGERHGPISHALLQRICGDDARLWREAGETAIDALEARVALWDATAAALPVLD